VGYCVVIPTIGRPSLSTVVAALARGSGPLPNDVIVVNDRPDRQLCLSPPQRLAGRLRVLQCPGRGPAAARNVGWRAATAPWIVFLDDDVVLGNRWREELAQDLDAAAGAAGVQGDLTVALPANRRPTDWERQVAALATAPWITADMAYRRDVLAQVDGFDERFPRAYREDTDLALRVIEHGHRLARGRRRAEHPVGTAGLWVSVSRQRGNADDALLRRLHGPHWRRLAGSPRGRRPYHAAIAASGLVAIGALALGRRRLAAFAAGAWLAGTAEFAGRRIVAGPRTWREIVAMALTSVVIPPVATTHWLLGWWCHRGATPAAGPRGGCATPAAGPCGGGELR
jgi:glycosyltransferase involved in cell wall biosynthesis